MSEVEILETEPFSKTFASSERREQDWIQKIRLQLRQKGFTGKPLRFAWFREKKFENKRLYFLVSEKKKRVLLLAFAEKKDQQKVIDPILLNKQDY